MKIQLLYKIAGIIVFLFMFQSGFAQDTFSIVAVDAETGEVGSAGASCLDNVNCGGCGGVIIISEVKPGKGAIHTQAYYLSSNQNNASNRMDMGESPQEIIDWLSISANDVGFNATVRQYGIVDFDDDMNPRSAAFTGNNTDDYKNHIVGANYAIQGNILLGQEILDSMESRFLSTQGSLAEKLMASLQGANVPGADTRCLTEGVSSQSAFIRVAKPDDVPGELWLEIDVNQTPFGVEPIDEVQTQFDEWLMTATQEIDSESFAQVYPNPNNGEFSIEINQSYAQAVIGKVYSNDGKLLQTYSLNAGINEIRVNEVKNRILILKLEAEDGSILKTKKIFIN